MTEIKTLQEKIEGTLKMINFTVEDNGKILKTEGVQVIKRHGSTLESILDKTHQLKLQVQELRIKNNADLEEVRSWSENLEAHIGKFEGTLKQIKHVATDIRSAKEEKLKKKNRNESWMKKSSWKRLNFKWGRNSRNQCP